jgi:hypothetical protein
MNYNPYFPGGGIAMGRVLYDGLVEYEDGVPSTTSQMAKDVVTFLSWTAEPELDERKKMGMQVSREWARGFGGRAGILMVLMHIRVSIVIGRDHSLVVDCHQFVREEGQVVFAQEQKTLYVASFRPPLA